MNPAMPLEGITVVELGTSVAAPYATLALAEMGALVLKIEHPKGGDPARSWGRPITDGQTLVFAACNRDKKSIALDLSDADSRRRLRELIRGRADVVVQNLRPGMASESWTLSTCARRNRSSSTATSERLERRARSRASRATIRSCRPLQASVM